MKKSKKWLVLIKLAPIAALAVGLMLLVVFYGRDSSKKASADDGHAGLNFSIGAPLSTLTGPGTATPTSTNTPGGGTPTATPVPDTCSTFSGSPNCTFALNQVFRVRVYLKSLPTGVSSYEGFDVQLNFSGVTFVERPNDSQSASPDAGANPTVGGNWPNCVFEAYGTLPGVLTFGCAIGVSASASTYTGRIATADFQCPAVNGFATVTMVHGTAGSTSITEFGSTKHAEGPGSGTPGAPESLSITCGSPPTATKTNTPTRTNTLTPTITSTPTNTSTPTITPTPSNTPTATPLPSDQPDVTIIKTDSPDPVAAGGVISYSLLVKNLGQQTASGIIASDFLPSEVVFISANSSDAICVHDGSANGGQVDCTLTTSLVQNQQVKIVIQVTAHSPPEDEHITNFAAVIAGNEPFFNQGNNNEFEQTVVLSPRPDLLLTKVDQVDPVESGDTVVYDLTADNLGPEPAQDVVIKDNLPAGAVYDDGNSSAECDPGGGGPDPDIGTVDVVCNLGTVTGQSVVQIAITVPTVTQDTLISNLAYISSSNELFSQTGNNLDGEFTAILAPDPDITIDKVGPVHVKRVEKFSYTLTITNIGLGDAFDVSVSDTLPMTSINSIDQPMTLQSVLGDATCGAVVAQVFTCTIDELAAGGGQVVLTVNVRAPTTLVTINLDNLVSVSDPDEPGEPTGNNNDSATTQIRACFDNNGDNLMRIHDILNEVSHYFAEPPDPLYDLIYDYDGSGKITVQDILYAVQHYFDDAPCVK